MNGPDPILQLNSSPSQGPTDVPGAAAPWRASYKELRAQDLTCEPIDPGALPNPYKQLLDHRDAMTPTLEAFFGQAVKVDVLNARTVGDNYVRKILMKTEDGKQICEWAIIWIALAKFDAAARETIFQGTAPFGRILTDCGITFRCEPIATFSVTPGEAMRTDLELGPDTGPLYGRRNQILAEDGHLLADAIEVLPTLS
jgi:chorismate-pyruvate lyase